VGNRLQGKVAIVTGSGGGIGRGTAKCLAAEGAIVVVNDINLANARDVVKEIRAGKGKAIAIKADVTRPAQVKRMIQRVIKRFGKIDVIINNAGVFGKHVGPPLTNITDEDWDQTFDVNVKGIFIMCKAVMPHMKERKKGKIINIASVAGKKPSVLIPVYSSSKAAVINFTQSLSEELAPYDIQVNAICPGIIWTPLWDALATRMTEQYPRMKGQTAAQAFNAVVTQNAVNIKREQKPEDIGMLAVFLASDESTRITGEAISVEGPTPVTSQ
jgi:NAD(P)-dependent dehydrogenase (short-subunit alcohol dehydrogenase family)